MEKEQTTIHRRQRRKRRFLWSVDLNLRSLRYLLFKVRPEPLRHLPLATCLVLAMLRPSMFAPSITRRPRVPVQRTRSLPPDQLSSPRGTASKNFAAIFPENYVMAISA